MLQASEKQFFTCYLDVVDVFRYRDSCYQLLALRALVVAATPLLAVEVGAANTFQPERAVAAWTQVLVETAQGDFANR